MTVVIPESITAQGNVKALWVPAIANRSAPTVAELTAIGVVDLSCFLMPDWAGVSADQNKGEQRRWCSKQTFEQLGQIRNTIADLVYTYLPQAVGTNPANKAYTTLTEGVTGFVVMRYGLDAQTGIAAAQKVDEIPSAMGARTKSATGGDEFAPLTVTQIVAVTGVPTYDVAVAA